MDNYSYIHGVGRWLQQKGYVPWPSGLLPNAVVDGDYFYRIEGNSLVLVKLISAGAHSPDRLLDELNSEFTNLEQLRQAKGLQFATQVVINIFDGPVQQEVAQKLLEAKSVSAVSRCYLLAWVVDLGAQIAMPHKGMPLGHFGLLSEDSPLKHPELLEVSEVQPVLADKEIKLRPRPWVMSTGVPWISYSIIAICVLLAVVSWFYSDPQTLFYATDTQTLVRMGAKVDSLIAAGEYWRLLTSVFLHNGILHLAFNMVFLYYMGPAVERFFGRWRYLAIFLLAGLSGSVASFAFSPGMSVGASGALFGLMGSYLYFWWRTPELGKRIGRDVVILIIFNLVYGQLNPSVDNWAHLGGLIGGFLASAIIALPKDKVPVYTRLSALIVLVVLLSWGIIYGLKAAL